MAEYIEREALLRDIEKYVGGEESRARFSHWVEVQPAADVVTWEELQKTWKIANHDVQPVRHGRWERKYSRPGVYADLYWHCTACGDIVADNWADKYNFCPNCGAVMQEAE